MRALGINFVQARPSGTLLGIVILGAGIASACLVLVDYWDARAELERVEQRQSRVQQAGAKPRVAASAGPKSKDDAAAAAKLATQLNAPWDLVLREIEGLVDPSVALLSIEAQGTARKIRLTGEAKSMDVAVAYVGRLRKSKWIEAAHLSGHEVKQIGAVSVTRFTVEAVWSPAQ